MKDTMKLRRQLHNYLEKADDKKIKAIYTIIERDILEGEMEYSEAFKDELETRLADSKGKKGSIISSNESKKRVNKMLTSTRK